MFISKQNAAAFAKVHKSYAKSIISKADENKNKLLSGKESKQLGDLYDTFKAWRTNRSSNSATKFQEFYDGLIRVMQQTREVPKHMVDNYNHWQRIIAEHKEDKLSKDERFDLAFEALSPSNIDGSLAHQVDLKEIPKRPREILKKIAIGIENSIPREDIDKDDFNGWSHDGYHELYDDQDQIIAYGLHMSSWFDDMIYWEAAAVSPKGELLYHEGDENCS